jgi:hypothetical protein
MSCGQSARPQHADQLVIVYVGQAVIAGGCAGQSGQWAARRAPVEQAAGRETGARARRGRWVTRPETGGKTLAVFEGLRGIGAGFEWRSKTRAGVGRPDTIRVAGFERTRWRRKLTASRFGSHFRYQDRHSPSKQIA